jgi:hypothetical protein
MSSGYPGWTKPGPYYDPEGPPWIEETGETEAERRRRRLLTLLSYIGVAVVAAGVAVALTLILHGSSAPSSGTATPPADQGQNAAPPGGDGSTQQQMLMVAGTVTKASRTSITIGGPNGQVTAAITSSTRITGNTDSAGDIKVGDRVSAQITKSNGHSVATAIQDPAQVP